MRTCVERSVMPKRLFIDYERCNGCEICALHCSFAKTGTFNPSLSRIHVIGWEEKGLYVPTVCLHCGDPPCLPACPEAAMSKDRGTEIVSIDYGMCTGCLVCLSACPYRTLTVDPVENQVLICDLCDGDPVCARVYPIGVIKYINTDELNLDEWQRQADNLSEILNSTPDAKERSE